MLCSERFPRFTQVFTDRLSLEVAPETGRRRFMAVSEEEETLVGKIALEQALQDFRGRILPFDHPITLQVRRITRRILTASNLGHLEGDHPQRQQRGWSTPTGLSAEVPQSPMMNVSKEWVVLVINDRKFINAFAAPGLVCVSTGIMSLARNEEGLAAIIGHGASYSRIPRLPSNTICRDRARRDETHGRAPIRAPNVPAHRNFPLIFWDWPGAFGTTDEIPIFVATFEGVGNRG